MEKGNRVPFCGTLLTDQALAKIITDYERKIKILELDLKKFEKDFQAQLKAKDTECNIKLSGQKAKYEGCIKLHSHCEKTLLNGCSTPWYKTPYFNLLAGSVLVGSVCSVVSFSQ